MQHKTEYTCTYFERAFALSVENLFFFNCDNIKLKVVFIHKPLKISNEKIMP